jgi:hypothetical protein
MSVIKQIIRQEGEIHLDWRVEGLACEIVFQTSTAVKCMPHGVARETQSVARTPDGAHHPRQQDCVDHTAIKHFERIDPETALASDLSSQAANAPIAVPTNRSAR